MELKQLQHFVVASDLLSFSAAADYFYTTRQTISYSVKSIEREFDIELFNRSRHALTLTDEGYIFAKRAKRLLHSVNDFMNDFRNYKTRTLKQDINLAITSSSSGFKDTFLNSLFECVELNSGFELRLSEISSKSCYEKILDRSIDVGIIRCMEQDFPGCSSFILNKTRFHLLMHNSNPLAIKDYITIEDVANLEFVFPRGYSFIYHTFFKKCAQHAISCYVKSQIDDVRLAFLSVKHSGCVIIMGEDYDSDLTDDFATVPFEDPELYWCDYLIYHDDFEYPQMFDCLIKKIRAAPLKKAAGTRQLE